MRCKVGSHTGEWEFDHYRECDQTRRCGNCGTVSTRVRHNWGEWDWADPDDSRSCESVRECRRCDSTDRETRHNLQWRYILDVIRDPSEAESFGEAFAAAAVRAMQESYGRCQQVLACRRCGYFDMSALRTEHDWGDWQPSQYRDTSRRACTRCGNREESD